MQNQYQSEQKSDFENKVNTIAVCKPIRLYKLFVK